MVKKEKQRDYSLHIVAAVALVAVFLLFAQQKAAPALSALPAADFSADMAEISEVTGNPVAGGSRQIGDQCSSNADCASRQCDWGLLLYRTSRPDTRSCASPRDCGSAAARCEVVPGVGRACQLKYCVAPRPQPNGARCARDQDCTSGWCQQQGVNYVCTNAVNNPCSGDNNCPDNLICRHPLTGERNDPPTSRNFDTSRSKVCAYKLDEGMPCTLDRDCKNNHCAFGRCAVTLTADQKRWSLGNICTTLQKGEKFIREKGVIEKRVGPTGAAKKGVRREVGWGSWVKTPLSDYKKIVIVHAADYAMHGTTGKFYIYTNGVRPSKTGELVARGTTEATPGEAWWANSPSYLWDSTESPGIYNQIRRQPPRGGNQAARNILLVHAADQQTRQIRNAYSFSSCRPCSNNPGYADYCFRELRE